MFAFLLAAQQTESIILARFASAPLTVLHCELGNKCISFRFSKNENAALPQLTSSRAEILACPISKNQTVQM